MIMNVADEEMGTTLLLLSLIKKWLSTKITNDRSKSCIKRLGKLLFILNLGKLSTNQTAGRNCNTSNRPPLPINYVYICRTLWKPINIKHCVRSVCYFPLQLVHPGISRCNMGKGNAFYDEFESTYKFL